MLRHVTNEFGTFHYEPTQFELLVEQLARDLQVEIDELNPDLTKLPLNFFREGRNFQREPRVVRYKKAIIPLEHSIKASSNPAYFAKHAQEIYSNDGPSDESLFLVKGSKELRVVTERDMEIPKLTVYRSMPEEDRALEITRTTNTFNSYWNNDMRWSKDFAFSSPTDRGSPLIQNYQGDLNNTFAFVRYLLNL